MTSNCLGSTSSNNTCFYSFSSLKMQLEEVGFLYFYYSVCEVDLKRLNLPVAVDRDSDDQQHGHNDSGDDDVE